jgi:SAM-dependent methyltransferase
MAIRAARHIDPERVELLVRRARLAGLMPTLRLGADRGLRQDLTSSSTIEAERLAEAVADDFRFEAALTFDLSRLVFAPEEVRLLSVQRWLAGDQRKLIEEVVRLYFKRRKLIEGAPFPDDDSAERELAIAEIEALLDAMTEGAYGRALTRKR